MPFWTRDWLPVRMSQNTGGVYIQGSSVPASAGLSFNVRREISPSMALKLRSPPTSELTQSRVPAGTYPSLLRHYQTVGLCNFAVAHADLPNDLVYNIVRVVFEKHEEMI